ncbi:MAG: preprotein translocase subunit SecE [Clostridia bacterium]|nr:preprotein translocase subunit SecE [Clostridia bacterium]
MAEEVKKVSRVKEFFKATKGEFKKIIWPNFKTVSKNTGIVVAYVILIGVIVFILDLIFGGVFNWAIGLLTK